ncbi:enoyl-CoA hydratase/isomerase family protein [Sulfitobacter sp. F26204]|uniref:enoyl-CoA hydratase/isomerase family protein n=1 Tax=Sulfitobacter sp. F26204 TaxID=2996014 RepID=UPI00225E671A|nr:enoyl-CoA hydratase/isomerase family protein [Sulfitobacter sp. F26204]MCX7560044.1 enoyl-CoA hydratase/isomerase family protein [Sulfitobacter sp. F26204]
MSDVEIRILGRAGRITLNRPKALNALTYEMCLAIENAFDSWRDDATVDLVVIDAAGDRGFCAGGDIAELYAQGIKGNYSYGQKFWADEYRLNHKIYTYAKPVVSFLQGFTMGGGVGIGCHGSRRVVGESSQIAMPECGIGLVPDVGGSMILARAPGRLGEYLGITATRMGPADAIFAGFADIYVPERMWTPLTREMEETGSADGLVVAAQTPPEGWLEGQIEQITALFTGEDLRDIVTKLGNDGSDFAMAALKNIRRNSPLSAACTVEMIHRLRGPALTMEKALDLEYRFTHRACEHGDFLEGIRAAIIDKDRAPKWQYPSGEVPYAAVTKMLQPLGAQALKL